MGAQCAPAEGANNLVFALIAARMSLANNNGTASAHGTEGIKGDGAVAQLVPLLRALLAAK